MNTAPTLDETRIDAMRGEVMSAVSTDLRRRGRRARRVAGLGVAAVMAVGGGVVGSALTGSDDPMPATYSADAGAAEPGIAPDIARDSAGGADAYAVEPAPDGTVAELSAPTTADGKVAQVPDDAEREVITTGSIAVEVSDPQDAASRLAAYVESSGGRVDNRSESDDYANLLIRVPSDAIAELTDELQGYGDVENVSINKSDVTTQGADLDARIAALQTSVDRLTQLLAQATDADKLIQAENALTQRQAELDGLRAQRESLTDQVEMSSIDVTLSQELQRREVDPDGFSGGLERGWNSVVDAVNNVVEGIGVALPWLGIAAAVGLLGLGVRRLRRR